jgi:hypothetical protein
MSKCPSIFRQYIGRALVKEKEIKADFIFSNDHICKDSFIKIISE